MKTSTCKAKNSFGRKFVAMKNREEYLVNRLDGVEPMPKKRVVVGQVNTLNNWDRASNGAKVWSF